MPRYIKFDYNCSSEEKIITNKINLDDKFIFSGVYFLFKKEKIIYVGSSVDIIKRIKGHLSEKTKNFDSYSYISCKETDLQSLESYYINKYLPIYNKIIEDKNYIIIGHTENKENQKLHINIPISIIDNKVYINLNEIKEIIINSL